MGRLGVVLIILGVIGLWGVPIFMAVFIPKSPLLAHMLTVIRVAIASIVTGVVLVLIKHIRHRKEEVKEENDYSEY